MAPDAIILTIALGLALGAAGGFFGIGGGLIAIPVLGLCYGMNEQAAQGTALVMMAPNVLMGLWKYNRRNRLDGRVAGTLAASAVACGSLSATFATRIASHELRITFATFITVIALYLVWRLRWRTSTRTPLAWGWASLVGATGGFLSGLFGVGGATIAPPALTSFFGMTQTSAQGLSLALITPTTIIALMIYAHAGAVDWAMGLPLAVGGVSGVPVGVAAAHNIPERLLRMLFCFLLSGTAVMLLLANR